MEYSDHYAKDDLLFAVLAPRRQRSEHLESIVTDLKPKWLTYYDETNR